MVVIIRAPIARVNADSIMHMPWKAVARAVKGMAVYDMKDAVYPRPLGRRQAVPRLVPQAGVRVARDRVILLLNQ